MRAGKLLPINFIAAARTNPMFESALESKFVECFADRPARAGSTIILVDVSGSMASPVTGARCGATTVTRCIDVAALIGASVLRRSFDQNKLPQFR